jgi:mannitol-specific phosphotransferase system IIBC component
MAGVIVDINFVIEANLLAKISVRIIKNLKGPLSGEVKIGLDALVNNLSVENEGDETLII